MNSAGRALIFTEGDVQGQFLLVSRLEFPCSINAAFTVQLCLWFSMCSRVFLVLLEHFLIISHQKAPCKSRWDVLLYVWIKLIWARLVSGLYDLDVVVARTLFYQMPELQLLAKLRLGDWSRQCKSLANTPLWRDLCSRLKNIHSVLVGTDGLTGSCPVLYLFIPLLMLLLAPFSELLLRLVRHLVQSSQKLRAQQTGILSVWLHFLRLSLCETEEHARVLANTETLFKDTSDGLHLDKLMCSESSVEVVLNNCSMSTPCWDSCNQEIVNYVLLLLYCCI